MRNMCIIESLIDVLTDRQKTVLFGHFVLGMNRSQVGKDLSISRERVRQLREGSLEVMLREMSKSPGEDDMSWQIIKKMVGIRYKLPLVTAVWMSREGKWVGLWFSFTVTARRELDYEEEGWCEISRDGSKLLFRFLREETEDSKKVARIYRKKEESPVNIRVGLYGKDVPKMMVLGKKVGYLLKVEEPKSGWIDLEKPVDRRQYLKMARE